MKSKDVLLLIANQKAHWEFEGYERGKSETLSGVDHALKNMVFENRLGLRRYDEIDSEIEEYFDFG